ncbi:MAG: 2-amino-4-hydroxy-6-hydroxymethyldihydropteridine diphosphokinase [Moraxella sp.]|nr:2-amino-4-hydroxy-6-hydroxymethyldihydropteridine diphosphokinase [Moraxella sp.]
MRHTIYIGLGGNIANEHGTPTEHLQNAINAFGDNPHFDEVVVSSFYRSKAYGVTDQPDFINSVLKAETDLSPLALLDFCQSLENTAGRVRLRRWGERCLDVDILLYGDENICNERLIVPHKELLLRNFVVIPMLEIDENVVVNGQALKTLDIASHLEGLEKLKN